MYVLSLFQIALAFLVPVRAQVASDPVFADDFETGDTSRWATDLVADDEFTAVAMSPLSIPPAGVLANDPGAVVSVLSAVLVTPPGDANATVMLSSDGAFVYDYAAPIAAPVLDTFTYRTAMGTGVARVAVTIVPEPTLTDIRVEYRLDPWLVGGTYGGGFWVSPDLFGPTAQSGEAFVMEIRSRAEYFGESVPSSPTWLSSDPSMVTVSPSHGETATMTIRHGGEATLYVDSQGVRSTLDIVATRLGNGAIQVEILQY